MTDLAGRTFVLVHGAWLGGWCWRDVAPILRSRGANVFAPTFTGMGERSHLRDSYKGLSTFIEDVCAVIKREELRDVILVGHSFGGVVITGVADRMPDSIGRLVYLDAGLPRDGQSMITQNIQNTPGHNAAIVDQMTMLAKFNNWLPPGSVEDIGLGDAPADIQDLARRSMTDHPVTSFTDAIVFENGGPKAPCTYILCDSPAIADSSFGLHVADIVAGHHGDGWTVRRLASGHMCMLTASEATAAALAEAALA